MTLSNTALAFAALNAFRAIDNLPPFADFRAARHAAPLAAYEVEYSTAATNMFEEALIAEQEARAADEATSEIATATKLPAYKVIARNTGNSVPDSPVALVHAFCDANPTMTRKQAVSALVTVHQVNYSTARTQYQKWFSKHKATAAATPSEE